VLLLLPPYCLVLLLLGVHAAAVPLTLGGRRSMAAAAAAGFVHTPAATAAHTYLLALRRSPQLHFLRDCSSAMTPMTCCRRCRACRDSVALAVDLRRVLWCRARKLLLKISTSWWKGLGQFRPALTPAVPQGAFGGGQVHYGGRIGRNGPSFGPKISAGRRPSHNLRNFGPSAREFRPVDELASPALECKLIAHCALALAGPWPSCTF
jgi:hypothetical protein